MMVATLALITALASYWVFLRGSLQTRAPVARWLDGGGRARWFALWCIKALVLFAGTSVLLLALTGWDSAVVAMPAVFYPARGLVLTYIGDARTFSLDIICLGLVGGGIVGGIVDRVRRGRRPWMLGDISMLVPRHRGELIWGGAMSVVAGVSEELYFRLLVPLLVTLITGQPLIGFAVGVALFAGAHRYQGWIGVAATGVVGLLMTIVYLATGQLWIAMVMHMVLDLNGLVLRPLIAGVGSVSPSSASRF
ncbi:MAG: CPBP family intramembrane metalloprotease [Sphingomonas bacterium]|nr:CPBP family intramembrane metalloprotease [Sphingomonas bacterium]